MTTSDHIFDKTTTRQKLRKLGWKHPSYKFWPCTIYPICFGFYRILL